MKYFEHFRPEARAILLEGATLARTYGHGDVSAFFETVRKKLFFKLELINLAIDLIDDIFAEVLVLDNYDMFLGYNIFMNLK